MKNYILLIVVLLTISCQNDKKTQDEKQSTPKVEKKDITNTVKEESKSTNCNNEKIAYDFLNEYIASCTSKSFEEIKEWFINNPTVSSDYVKRYQEIFDNNEYVEFDPVLFSRDVFTRFIIKKSKGEYVSLTGGSSDDSECIVRIKDCKVIGSGLINISKSLYDNGIENLTTEQQIQEIREVYVKVNNNLSTYKVTESENEGSTEGGSDKVYIHNNQIVKVTQEYLGEMGKRTIEYYFTEDGNLRFVFDQITNYNAPMYITKAEEGIEAFDPKKSTVEENRYYFYNEKMIRWIDKSKNKIDVNTSVFQEKAQELLKISQKYQ